MLRLLDQGFKNPKPGKTDDNSHPPIHPTKHALLDGRDKAVYELVVRHFLACCSDDALGQETTVSFKYSLINYILYACA
jgi:DNA topoisomerase-3